MIFGRSQREPVVVAVCKIQEEADEIWQRLMDEGIPASVQFDPAMLGGKKTTQVLVEKSRRVEALAFLSEDEGT